MHEIGYLIINLGALALGYYKIKKGQQETTKAITNDHKEPLRDDLDSKHNELIKRLDNFENRQERLEEKIDQINQNGRESRARIWKEIDQLKERINPWNRSANNGGKTF